MDHELESIKTDFVDVKKVLNMIYLHNRLSHYAWLVHCLILVFSDIQCL